MPRVLLGNPDGVAPDSDARHSSFHPREEFYPIDFPPSADISYPEFRAPTFHIWNSVRRHFTSGYLTTEWERRTLQLLRIDISGPSDNAYHESFSLSIQCYGVLLKLSDISDRHPEIF